MVGSPKDPLWVGRSTTAFRVFNWELFVTPRRWLMLGGAIIALGVSGSLWWEIRQAQTKQEKVKHNRRVQELAAEIKQRDLDKERASNISPPT